MDANNIDSEDENVIIQGSALHEHLYKLGYTDFESITVHKTILHKNNTSKFTNFVNCVKDVIKKLWTVYSCIIQEECVSKTQLTTILDVKALLNDHMCIIHDLLEKCHGKSWSDTLLELILFGGMTSSIVIALNTRYEIPVGLFASSTLLFTSYIKYTRLYAYRDLKSVVSLQNDLFDLCKRGLKVLRYGYKIKVGKGKCTQQFYDLTADRLKYLQPIMENLVKYMEQVSHIYYQVSLILIKLLPKNNFCQDSLTQFDTESFEIHGEINYQVLKTLYHTYILTQSEMLHLFAIAYDSHTWQQSCSQIPEFKLAYIIYSLVKYLTTYKNKLSRVIDAYYDFKVEPVIQKYKGPIVSKWQDLYVHLYLTSNKLQLAYSHILSILQDIDNSMSKTTIDNESVETAMQKLNEAYKEIDSARNFAEFSTLLVAKTRLDNRANSHSDANVLVPVVNSDLPVINCTEPQIMDEVFEEYIKEEYLKPLYEESDDISFENYKWDKFLAKNFMAELKEALIDKQKSMSERESKALQRMYKHMIKDTDFKANCQRIPSPPPMPPSSIFSITPKQTTSDQSCNKTIPIDHKSMPLSETKKGSKKETVNDSSDEERYPVPFIPLPKVQSEARNTEFPLSLPPSFLKTGEEMFIGSGENSEDEFGESKNNDSET